jgi:hypothetical protein
MATIEPGIQIMRQFQDEPEQVRLIEWFQESTGLDRQRQFAQMWRASETDYSEAEVKVINFVDCFRFYQNLSQQNLALKWLQQTTVPATWHHFSQSWEDNEYARISAGVQLNVPFFDQTLLPDGWRKCNTASNAMAANGLGVTIAPEDYLQIVNQFGDTTAHRPRR